MLCEVYVFIGDGRGPHRRLPDKVVKELVVVQGILPLLEADVCRGVAPRAYCSDASGEGYALHVTTIGVEEALAADNRPPWAR